MSTPTIRTYHGESGEPLEEWTDFGVVEVSFALTGPDAAKIDVPRTAPYLHHRRSMPGGVGVFLEVDGRDLGAPDIWTGRLLSPQFSGDGETVGLSLKGPEEWLSRIGVPVVGRHTAPASAIVQGAIQSCPAQTWLAPTVQVGSGLAAIPYETSGEALWPLMVGLAEARGEEFRLVARRGEVYFDLHWGHPLGAVDASAEAILVHGKNCSLSSSAILAGLPLSELVGVALSFGEGADVSGALVKSAPVSRWGRSSALTAALSSTSVRRLAGSGAASEALPAPELTSEQALIAMLETTLRREMVATATAQIQDVEPDLWQHLSPGTLVSCRLPDPSGLFSAAVARVRTTTFRLAPDIACSLSLELWRLEDPHG